MKNRGNEPELGSLFFMESVSCACGSEVQFPGDYPERPCCTHWDRTWTPSPSAFGALLYHISSKSARLCLAPLPQGLETLSRELARAASPLLLAQEKAVFCLWQSQCLNLLTVSACVWNRQIKENEISSTPRPLWVLLSNGL